MQFASILYSTFIFREDNDDEAEQEIEQELKSTQFWEELHIQNLYMLDFSAMNENELHIQNIGQRPLFPYGRRILVEPSEEIKDPATVDAFLEVLKRAVQKRVVNLPPAKGYVSHRFRLVPNEL